MSAAKPVLPEGDWIRGITIKQPWATCILTGAKTIENRSGRRRPGWKPGWVLLHAGQRIDRPALRIPLVARTIHGRQMPTGAVIGIARIIDCHQDPAGEQPCTEWAEPGAWHLALADVQGLALPVPAGGQLGPGSRRRTWWRRCSSSCPPSGREHATQEQEAAVRTGPDPGSRRPPRMARQSALRPLAGPPLRAVRPAHAHALPLRRVRAQGVR
ncbi:MULTISPECIES: hypothetical protein [Streptomyces violaceusniger group]